MEKSTEINLNVTDSQFLEWVILRLHHVHGYKPDSDIIKRLLLINHKFKLHEKHCVDEDLDKIISQYFVDFFLTRDDTTSIGYTNQERNNLRNAIRQIIADVKLNKVPKDIILK